MCPDFQLIMVMSLEEIQATGWVQILTKTKVKVMIYLWSQLHLKEEASYRIEMMVMDFVPCCHPSQRELLGFNWVMICVYMGPSNLKNKLKIWWNLWDRAWYLTRIMCERMNGIPDQILGMGFWRRYLVFWLAAVLVGLQIIEFHFS